MLDPEQVARAWRRKEDGDRGPTPIHRWSGWPGAYCLDCGAPDPSEEAIAHGCLTYRCAACGEEQPSPPTPDCWHRRSVKSTTCSDHQSTACPEPYSRRFDPYPYVGATPAYEADVREDPSIDAPENGDA